MSNIIHASTVAPSAVTYSRTATLKERITTYLDCRPGSDDFEIADALGEVAFAVSVALGELEAEGFVYGSPWRPL